jgi:uncharacterized membrane protein YkvA (DUF1232 family)
MSHPIEIELSARERRLYDRVRSTVRPGLAGPSDLRDVLLLLPDLVMLMLRLLRDERVAIGDKLLAAAGIAYVLSPIDLLPTFLFGPFGLLDDAVVVAATLSRLVNHVHPDVVRSHWSGQGDALRAVQRVADWSERRVGRGIRDVVKRILPG